MKQLILIVLMAFSVSVFASSNGKLEIGDKAVLTDVKMTDVSGKSISLNDVKKENGVLVVFSCNTCPFVGKWEERYSEIKAWADKNKVGMVVVNSNHQKRDGEESLEAMKKHAADKNYNFFYAVDHDSRLANAFGGQTTPHAFLFDSKMTLVYKGAIDDSYESADKVKYSYVKDAISSISSGKEVAITETKPVGCGIKRKISQEL
ncbi:MAG: redoxin domain-containing protein [Draconibacterium sp.]